MAEYSLYDTSTLLGVFEQDQEHSSYFLDTHFKTAMLSENEYIDFEKVYSNRKLAPFVVPTAQGVPIYSKSSRVTRFKPAYVKPKDSIDPARILKRQPGSLLYKGEQSSANRYNALVGSILIDQHRAIHRTWEYLAARAIIDASVTIEDDRYPRREVYFERDVEHTVTLAGTAKWNNPNADIIGNLNTWISRVRTAKFGGPVNRITVSPEVWSVMIKNEAFLKTLDNRLRGTTGDFNIGVFKGDLVEYVGTLNGYIDIYVNSDYYELADGYNTTVRFMKPGELVLSGPNVLGVRAYGAILDHSAGMHVLPLFPKMWNQEDPSATFIMTQSAPLMIPVNPNNTLKATVL